MNHATPPTIAITQLDPAGLSSRLDDLADILHACVHDGASVNFILPFDRDRARRFWRDKVEPGLIAGTRVALIAALDGQIAGTVQLDLATPPNQVHRAEIAKLLVHPRHRRSGVARALMQAIEGRAAEAGRWLLTLDTASDAAERLYLALGYQRVGAIPFYARDPIDDRFDPAIFMFKLLPRPAGAGDSAAAPL